MNLRNFYPKKRFGQHWLINKKVLEKIKKSAELNENDFILEIGPGKGALTSILLDSEIRGLHAVELDKDLIKLLNSKFSKKDKFSLQQGDILSIDLTQLDDNFTKVIANIPYNITGPILDMFIGRLGHLPKYDFKKIIFLMQKEVVDRIVAKAGSSNNSALSIRIKLLSEVEKICDISSSCFNPAPKVDSALVTFNPLPVALRLDLKLEICIDKLLKRTFNARRKKMRNTLSNLLSKEKLLKLEEESEINLNLRPQDLSIDEWIKIAKLYINIK